MSNVFYFGYGDSPLVVRQIKEAAEFGLSIVVMGSNIGIESTFFALTHPDVQVFGYDLLCPFVDLANQHKVESFHCQRNLAHLSVCVPLFLPFDLFC